MKTATAWRRLRRIGFVLACLCTAPAAQAQAYPAKPVHIVVPFAPGGTADVLARVVGNRIAETTSQQVIVDNRPGGGTLIGTEFVARAPADGYTLLLVGNSFTINPALRSTLPYDIQKDFAPITIMVNSPQVLVVNPTFAARTLGEFLAQARARPGQLSYATVGPGTTQHIAFEMLRGQAQVDLVYAPFAGGAPAVNALLGNHVNVVLANYSEVAQQIIAGKLRPLAVASRERIEPLKEVPTIAESGGPALAGFEAAAWFGLVAPSATPRAALQRLNQETGSALRHADTRDKLVAQGLYPAPGTAEQFAELIRTEMVKYAKVVRERGIKVD